MSVHNGVARVPGKAHFSDLKFLSATGKPDPAPPKFQGSPSSEASLSLLCLINADRKGRGLNGLLKGIN